MSVTLKPWIHDLRDTSAPVFIGAPVGRSGTTALQRLLSTDSSIAVYAEDNTLINTAVMAATGLRELAHRRDDHVRRRSRIRDNTWHQAVLPHPDAYMHVHLETIYGLLGLYQRDAEELGSRRWGMKRPLRSVSDLLLFKHFLPETRVIYVIRDIKDCLRSYKSYVVSRQHDLGAVAATWVRNIRDWRKYRDRCLAIDFRRLASEPESVSREVAEYLALRLDSSPLDLQINTASGYVPPADLTNEELNLVREARAAAQWHGSIEED